MNEMYLLHSESMIMCMILIILLFAFELSSRQGTSWKRYLVPIYLIVITQLVIDGIWYVIDGNTNLIVFHKIIQTIYLCLYPVLGWTWLDYSSTLYLTFNLKDSKTIKAIKYVTITINAILVFLSWNTGIVYLVNENGTYIRGPLLMFTNGITYITMITATVLSAIEAVKTTSLSSRRHFIAKAAYAVPVFIMGMAQLLTPPGITSVYFGFVISFAMMLIDSLSSQITEDSLTKLYNQRMIEKIIHDAISHYNQNTPLVLAIYDLDKFKEINDTFGHSVGDEAIICAASTIARLSKKYGFKASRIHGDEFVLFFEGVSFTEADKIAKEVQESIFNDSRNKEYQLSISYGLALYEINMTERNLFDIADARLYEQKRERKENIIN